MTSLLFISIVQCRIRSLFFSVLCSRKNLHTCIMMYVFCLWFVCHIAAALTVCYVAKMSKLHRIISEHNVVDNKPSPHTFSVPIQETPMWKIQAVAKYANDLKLCTPSNLIDDSMITVDISCRGIRGSGEEIQTCIFRNKSLNDQSIVSNMRWL